MLWKRFKKHKPTEDGWYLCTLRFPESENSLVMLLYWHNDRQVFLDEGRQNVFDMYHVYMLDGTTNRYNKQFYTDFLCDRTVNVVAWKKEPKPYKPLFKRKKGK